MPKGISIHFGLDYVDEVHYGSKNWLPCCTNDAIAMQYIAEKNGFECYRFLNEEANSHNLFYMLSQAAEDLRENDLLFVSFSGHGAFFQDLNGDEKDRKDEAICLYNRKVIDDELYLEWMKFQPGVRILFVSDSCYSGSITKDPDGSLPTQEICRNMLDNLPNEIYLKNKWQYDAIFKNITPKPKTEVGCSVLLLSACQEMETAGVSSSSDAQLSFFTEVLMDCWAEGSFYGTYKDFYDLICLEMKRRKKVQTPNYNIIGANHPLFQEKLPFTI